MISEKNTFQLEEKDIEMALNFKLKPGNNEQQTNSDILKNKLEKLIAEGKLKRINKVNHQEVTSKTYKLSKGERKKTVFHVDTSWLDKNRKKKTEEKILTEETSLPKYYNKELNYSINKLAAVSITVSLLIFYIFISLEVSVITPYVIPGILPSQIFIKNSYNEELMNKSTPLLNEIYYGSNKVAEGVNIDGSNDSYIDSFIVK